MDKCLLVAGGYVAGTSLTEASLMVAMYMRNVNHDRLRDTLFVLWFILVTIKMATFIALSVDLHFKQTVMLIHVAAIGHMAGLKTHQLIMRREQLGDCWK